MVATLPWAPYINMIPAGFTADGSVTYIMTGGIFAEVFDTLQVSDAYVNDDNDHLTCLSFQPPKRRLHVFLIATLKDTMGEI